MTEQPVGPRCGNNPNIRLTPGDRKAVEDFKARLALQAEAKPYIERAAWVDFDPLMEVIAATVWEHCARNDEEMPQLVCDDPRTIAAFAAAVARAHAAAVPAPAADRAAELLALATVLEIPRPGTGIPLQLRRSYGHSDRWAICDRTGRRWHREHGWVYEPDGIRDEAQRDATRYTLAEAEPLARELADPSRMAAEEPQS